MGRVWGSTTHPTLSRLERAQGHTMLFYMISLVMLYVFVFHVPQYWSLLRNTQVMCYSYIFGKDKTSLYFDGGDA